MTPYEIIWLVVFFLCFTLFVFGLALSVCIMIGHLFNILWILLAKWFPKIPSREQLEKTFAENERVLKEFMKHDS